MEIEKDKWTELEDVLRFLEEGAKEIDEALESGKFSPDELAEKLNPKIADTYHIFERFAAVLKRFEWGEIPEVVVNPWHSAVCKLIKDLIHHFGPNQCFLDDMTIQCDFMKAITGRHGRDKGRGWYLKEIEDKLKLLTNIYIKNANEVARSELRSAPKPRSENRRGRPKAEDRGPIIIAILNISITRGVSRPKALKILHKLANSDNREKLMRIDDGSWLRYVTRFVRLNRDWRERALAIRI